MADSEDVKLVIGWHKDGRTTFDWLREDRSYATAAPTLYIAPGDSFQLGPFTLYPEDIEKFNWERDSIPDAVAKFLRGEL